MGKKKNLSGQNSGSKAFADQVGKANLEALRPAIEQMGTQIQRNLAKQQLSANADLVTMIVATQKVMISKGIATQEDFKIANFEVQEEAWGLEKKDTGAEEGDFLRVSYKVKDKDGNYGKDNKQTIRKFKTNDEGFPQEFIDGLAGMKAGEVKEISFKVENSEESVIAELTMDRVCKAK